MTAPQPAPAVPDRSYPLYLREGAGRFYFRLTNQGLTLTADGLAWTYDGQERQRRFDDIHAIRLQLLHIHRSGDFGVCEIQFRDGLKLRIHGGSDKGYADDTQAQAYAACMRDLHARLVGNTAIRYLAGNTEGHHMAGIVIMVIAGLFFIGTPFVLLFLMRRWEVLGVLLAGAGFLWPFFRMVNANAPRNYSPEAVPADLLP